MTTKFRILGSGEWGLAIAYHLSQHDYPVEIYGRTKNKIDDFNQKKVCKSLNIKFNQNVSFNHLANIANQPYSDNTHNLIATSSSGFADLLNQNKNYLSKYSNFIWLTKGLDKGSKKFFDELLCQHFGSTINCCLISGPSFAKDLVGGENISVSIASNSNDYMNTIEKCFISDNFIMHKTNDLIGVQVSGVMKNVAAILSGILTSNNYDSSDILKMIAITKKEIFEITKYIYATRELSLDNDEVMKTLESPSCDGDLKLSCLSDQSRNRRFGLRLSGLNSFEQIIDDIGTVEGYVMTPVLHDMVRENNIGPILKSVNGILFKKQKLDETEIINYL